MKGILVKAFMLKLPNFDKYFKIHFDASNFKIKGTLVQDGKLVAFESKKLNKMEQKWLTHSQDP